MADTLTVLYYANNRWNELKNRDVNPGYDSNFVISSSNKPYAYVGGNPVLGCEIDDIIGAPLEMRLTLSNRQNTPRKTFVEPVNGQIWGDDPLVNPQVGQFHNLLVEHVRIIVHESNTMMTLFAGQIYVSDETYQLSQGSIYLLTCRDDLEIVSNNSLEQLKENNSSIYEFNSSW